MALNMQSIGFLLRAASGVPKGLGQRENLAEGGSLATVGAH